MYPLSIDKSYAQHENYASQVLEVRQFGRIKNHVKERYIFKDVKHFGTFSGFSRPGLSGRGLKQGHPAKSRRRHVGIGGCC